MTIQREIIKIDEELCNGCGLCVPNCAEGSLVIIDGKAKMVADKYCDGLGACLGHCPQGALSIEIRDADEYDHAAVEDLLARPQEEREALAKGEDCLRPLGGGGGCPGAGMMTMKPAAPAISTPNGAATDGPALSALSHWPIQLRLVPPTAPFLRNAHLLLAADCTAASIPDFHARFVPGKVLLMGCPKFDDVDLYVDRLSEIFRNNDIASVTMLRMEVPCCGSLGTILEAALGRSKAKVEAHLVVAARDGRILEEKGLF